MTRFEELIETVDGYQKRAGENYDRIRRLATDLKDGFCKYLGSGKGVCVHLVPPVGPFQPKTEIDKAFTIAPRGFRPLGPIAFGLAVRVTKETDWIRLAMRCHKLGERFTVYIEGGPTYTFQLPLAENDTTEFYDILFAHIKAQFTEAVERYDRGSDARSMGFDFNDPETTDTGG